MQQLIHGDCLEALKTLEENSIDSLVTDPPAGISFMGKAWDDDKGGRDQWIAWMTEVMKECMRVLKPGAHGVVWAIPRTSHWTATALENAGFEVRDIVTHLFGSGFPKSMDISKAIDKQAGVEGEIIEQRKPDIINGMNKSRVKQGARPNITISDGAIRAPATDAAKQWQGWGTALKPASEHWILVRKPCSEKTVAANVIKHGTGGINIEVSRIESESRPLIEMNRRQMGGNTFDGSKDGSTTGSRSAGQTTLGRFPANLILSHSDHCTEDQCDIECAIKMLDEQSGECKSAGKYKESTLKKEIGINSCFGIGGRRPIAYSGETGGASRFFYCAKASKSDKNTGLDGSNLVWEYDSWEKQDLNSSMENINRLSRDISEDGLMENKSWSTDLYGRSILEQSQQGFKYTIETVLKLIIGLKTSNVSQPLNIKENILDVIKTIEVNGLSLAETVKFINQLNLISIKEEMELVLNVVHAVLKELLIVRNAAKTGNFHSTVKASKLMAYLIKLVAPTGGVVLDPFAGSGSTGVAALKEGFSFIGIEQHEEYFNLMQVRLK